jgi:addiction module HigA family antidote
MTMKNPPHPGRSIRSACLEPLGLSISEAAKILGVSRQALNNVIAGKSAISPDQGSPSALPAGIARLLKAIISGC